MRPMRLEPHLDFSCRGSASLDLGINISGSGAIEACEARVSASLSFELDSLREYIVPKPFVHLSMGVPS